MLILCSVSFVNQFGEFNIVMHVISFTVSLNLYKHAGLNLIFPFLPYMVHDFFPELDRTQIGQFLHVFVIGVIFRMTQLIGKIY